MKKILNELLVLIVMLMPTMALADGLTNHSSVGSVGMLNGREAIVVELNIKGVTKKVAVATMNVGATSVDEGAGRDIVAPCHGKMFTFADANNASKTGLSDGWYVPSKDELEALMNKCSWNGTKKGLEWISEDHGTSFFLPVCGFTNPNATTPIYRSEHADYWTSTESDASNGWNLFFNANGKQVRAFDKTYKFNVRPFCELPNEVASEEGVEIGGVKYNLFAVSHIAEVCRQYYDYTKGPTSVNIPSTVQRNGIVYNVKSIGASAFYCSFNLAQVTLPNSIETIGFNAFADCSMLSLTVPKSVKSIGSFAFDGNSELQTIYFWSKEPPAIGYDIFVRTKLLTDGGTIYVQNDSYLTAPRWSNYVGNIVPLDDLNTYVATLLNGDAPSSELASVIVAGHEAIEACSTVQSAQNVCATAKNNINAQYLADKKTECKEAIDAAKSGYDASILNTLATLYKDFIDTATDVEVVREQSAAGVAAIQAAIAFRNDVYSTPTGAGMRLKVTKKDGKVYEFNTSEVESVDYHRVTE